MGSMRGERKSFLGTWLLLFLLQKEKGNSCGWEVVLTSNTLQFARLSFVDFYLDRKRGGLSYTQTSVVCMEKGGKKD